MKCTVNGSVNMKSPPIGSPKSSLMFIKFNFKKAGHYFLVTHFPILPYSLFLTPIGCAQGGPYSLFHP